MKLTRRPMLALACAALLCIAPAPNNPSPVIAQAATASDTQPEEDGLYGGIAMPSATRAVPVTIRSFDGRITIADVLVENGATVKEGQLLATLKMNDYEGRLKAAEESIASATFELTKADSALKQEREVREYNIAKAELDLRDAQQEVKNFKEFGKEDSILQGRQRLENAQNSIKDQEDELKQLRKLYGKNELASESQDIVLNRSERRLKSSKESLKIEEHRFKILKESTIPAQEWKLPHEVNKAERALQKARFDQRDNIESKEKALAAAQKALANANKKLEDMRADAERLEIKATKGGTVIFGSLEGNDGFDGGVRNGAAARLQQTLFTIVNLDSMVAEISVPVVERKGLLTNRAGTVAGHAAKITGVGLIAKGERLAAKIQIEAKGEIMIGQRITFKR